MDCLAYLERRDSLDKKANPANPASPVPRVRMVYQGYLVQLD